MTYARLLAIALPLTLVACDKDDDTAPVTAEDLVGTWELTRYDSETDASIAGVSTTSTIALVSDDVTIAFREDGTYTQMGSAVTTLEASTNGGSLPASELPLDFRSSGEYRVEGGKLYGINVATGSAATVLDGEEYGIDLTLDGATLDMRLDTEVTQELQGVDYATSVNVKAAYERQ